MMCAFPTSVDFDLDKPRAPLIETLLTSPIPTAIRVSIYGRISCLYTTVSAHNYAILGRKKHLTVYVSLE